MKRTFCLLSMVLLCVATMGHAASDVRSKVLEMEGVEACNVRAHSQAEEKFQGALESAASPSQIAVIHNRLGDLARWRGRVSESAPHYQSAISALRRSAVPALRERAWAHYGLAQVAAFEHREDAADSLYDLVFKESRGLEAAQDPLFARFLYGSAIHLAERQDFGSALGQARRAIGILKINRGENPGLLPEVLLLAAQICGESNNTDMADSYVREADIICGVSPHVDVQALARVQSAMGWLHLRKSEFSAAEERLMQSMQSCARITDVDLNFSYSCKAAYAEALIGLSRYSEAERFYGEALGFFEAQSNIDPENLGQMRTRVEELRKYLLSTEQAALAAQEAAARPTYESRYSNGTNFQIGTLGDLQVWVAAWKGSEIEALVYVVNGTDHAITFDPGDVLMESVSESNGESRRTKVKTFTAQQWETKINNSNSMSMFFAALGAGLANTPQPQTTYVSGSVNDSYGYGSYYGTITTWPSQSEIAEANARTRAQLQSMSDQLNDSFSAMSQTLMRIHTLDPHSFYGGKVYMNKKGKNYVMTVPYDGHTFEFSLQWE